MKSTLVIGATPKTDRYANMAVNSLVAHDQPVIAYGRLEGSIGNISIQTTWNPEWEVDTVTLYLSPKNQSEYYDKIIALAPERVIFNPGTENPEFFDLLRAHNIYVEVACTLVLLSTGQYTV